MEISIEGVRVERDGRVLLNVASLRLRGGRTIAILGPNGSGKTTLLRVIAGLDQPRAGKILIGGLPADASRVAYVFQEQVFLRQSVRNNLELGLSLRGLNPAERKVRIDAPAEPHALFHGRRRFESAKQNLVFSERRRVLISSSRRRGITRLRWLRWS